MTMDLPAPYTLSGSPYHHNAKMEGRPLQTDELFAALDLERPGLEAVKAAYLGFACGAPREGTRPTTDSPDLRVVVGPLPSAGEGEVIKPVANPRCAPVKAAVEKGDGSGAAAALLAYYRERRQPGWMTGHSFDPIPARRVVGRAGDLPKLPASDDDRRIADDAGRHVFHVLRHWTAYPPQDYGPEIDWDANPVGDIEWPCGMHRLQYWDGAVTRCYSATGDERYARLWIDLIADWIRKNPLTFERLPFPKSWDAIQVGIRSQRLAANLPRYLDSPACTPEFLVEVLTSLYNHARRIEQMPYPNRDNFVMIETLGLAGIAALFPEFRDAPKWKGLVLERLTAAWRDQVLPDGTHGELTPGYHVMIAGYYLELIELFGVEAVTPELRAATERMSEFGLVLCKPDRTMFVVGDSTVNTDLRSFLARIGHGLNRPDILALATDGLADRWPKKRNFAFPGGGFYSFRSGWDSQAVWIGLECGPAPIDPFHSQFDCGTFELMAFGRLLMRDPGVFNYKHNDPGREALRRTAAHQCLTLNGANAVRAGTCLQWIEDDGRGNVVLTVENASYPGLTHRRTVFFVQRRWFVLVDEALGNATGDLDLHFQLTPGPAVIDPSTKTARTAFPEGGNVLVWTDPSAPVTLESEKASFAPCWFGNEPLPAFRYRHQQRQAPARFVTVLAPYEGITAPTVGIDLEDAPVGAGMIRLRLTVGGTQQTVERSIR